MVCVRLESIWYMPENQPAVETVKITIDGNEVSVPKGSRIIEAAESMGKGIAHGEYLAPTEPTDIAPTLAFLAGVTLPNVRGRVLIEALAPPAAPRRSSQ